MPLFPLFCMPLTFLPLIRFHMNFILDYLTTQEVIIKALETKGYSTFTLSINTCFPYIRLLIYKKIVSEKTAVISYSPLNESNIIYL